MVKSAKTTRKTNVNKTLSFPISFYGQCEEILNQQNLKDYETVIQNAVNKMYVDSGLGIAP